MAEFESRTGNPGGRGRWLWHFDGRKTDWRLDVRDGGGGRRPGSDLDDSRLRHYMRMGAIRSDIEEEKERAVPVGRKGEVAAWLAVLAAAWVACRFIEL